MVACLQSKQQLVSEWKWHHLNGLKGLMKYSLSRFFWTIICVHSLSINTLRLRVHPFFGCSTKLLLKAPTETTCQQEGKTGHCCARLQTRVRVWYDLSRKAAPLEDDECSSENQFYFEPLLLSLPICESLRGVDLWRVVLNFEGWCTLRCSSSK